MGLKVLVVEDDSAIAQTLTSTLQAEHSVAEVRITGDPADAVTQVRNFRPDVVVIDAVGMEMPGADVGTRVRAAQEGVVIVSLSEEDVSPTWADVSILKGDLDAVKKVVRDAVSEPEIDELRKFIHDLRNPIGALTGFVHLIQTQRDNLTPEQFEGIVEGISRSATRLGKLVDEFSEKRQA
ncbi:MAG: response regulator [Actinomycetota bacterium]